MPSTKTRIDCLIQASINGTTWVDLVSGDITPWPHKRAIVAPEAITELQDNHDKMLKALRDAENWLNELDHDPGVQTLLVEMRAVIAKATEG